MHAQNRQSIKTEGFVLIFKIIAVSLSKGNTLKSYSIKYVPLQKKDGECH